MAIEPHFSVTITHISSFNFSSALNFKHDFDILTHGRLIGFTAADLFFFLIEPRTLCFFTIELEISTIFVDK